MTRSGRILVVDDDPDILGLVELRLNSAGYDVATAESAEAALVYLDARVPNLVITDLRMPGLDGMALFEALRRRHPALPVIVLTAHGTIPDAVAATRQGVFGFITKPYDPPHLLEQVEQAIALSSVRTNAGADEAWRRHIVTRNSGMEALLAQVRLVAQSDASVLIQGPSGSGKEMVARAIHNASSRAQRPFVAINCGAIPENLLESELFGHVKGAFTGAARDHKGLFLEAQGGTLFLDEIGDMPAGLQVKLLRVLEEREVRPVGSNKLVPVEVRVISATHRDLDLAIETGGFREDLYYRLNVVMLLLPSLAERRDDIPLLAQMFLDDAAGRYGREVKAFAPEALEALVSAAWSGNVRQLRNVVERCVTLATTPVIGGSLVQMALRNQPSEFASFEDARRDFERDYLVKLLRITSGNVRQAAKLAQRNRTDFYKLLQRHQLEPGQFKEGRE